MAFNGYNAGSGNSLMSSATLAHGIGSGDFAVAGWVYRVLGYSSTFLYMNGSLGSTFAVQVADGALGRFAVWCAGTYRFDSTVPTGAWTHLAVVRRSGLIYGYVNGVQEATTITNSISLGTDYQYVAGREYVADLALWSEGPSAAEIAALAKWRRPPAVRLSGLKAYWGFQREIVDRWSSGLVMNTQNGAASYVDHPPMIEELMPFVDMPFGVADSVVGSAGVSLGLGLGM